jgi:hypothetical protein
MVYEYSLFKNGSAQSFTSSTSTPTQIQFTSTIYNNITGCSLLTYNVYLTEPGFYMVQAVMKPSLAIQAFIFTNYYGATTTSSNYSRFGNNYTRGNFSGFTGSGCACNHTFDFTTVVSGTYLSLYMLNNLSAQTVTLTTDYNASSIQINRLWAT